MDNSASRWGRPSWHTREEVGVTALNDCVGITNFCYILLKRYLSDDTYYFPIVHEFWNYSFMMSLGFIMEFQATREFKKGSLDSCTKDWYMINTMRKSAPGFMLPFQIAIHLAKNFDERANRIIQHIIYEIGYLYLVQVRRFFPPLILLHSVLYFSKVCILSIHNRSLNDYWITVTLLNW